MATRVAEVTAATPATRRAGAQGAGSFKYALVAPAVFVLLAFGLFPFLYAVVVSFQKLSLLDQYTSFQGALNYARLLHDQRLWSAVLHTVAITVAALPLQLVLGLLLAHHFLAERRFKRLFIALLIIPAVISPMVAGSMWRLMFDDRYGPINQMIGWVLGHHVSILWTIQAAWAYPAIVICDVWEWTPFMFIILLAALSNVDGEQLDAASLDGAGAWQSFRYVSLPAIWPVMMIALLIRGLDLDPAVRHRLAADPRRPRQRYGDDLDLHVRARFPGVRDQLHGRHGRRVDLVVHRGSDRGTQAHGDRTVKRWRDAGWYLASIAIALVFLFPVYWMFAVSLKTPQEIFKYPPAWYPSHPQLMNFWVLFRDGDVWSVWNSFVIASTSTLIAMVLGTLCAYSIVRFKTGGENLAVWILSQRMLPPIAVVFPIFLLYAKVGWADTYHGLILLYTAFALPYVIWMMRGYLQEVPIELEESALVDGCSRWQVLRHVVVPVARSGLFATAVFAFIFSWNEFLFALVLTRTQVLTYPVQISQYFGSQSTFWAKISAMSVLGTLPVFFAVAAFQRYLVRGISLGAVKG